jgi:5-formyltetrahydrofolate cyclo-ligase
LKRSIREALLRKRNRIRLAEKKVKETAIRKRLFALSDFKEAKSILFYASFRSEVDTMRCMQQALKLRKKIALPLVDGKRKRLKLYEIKGLPELVSGYMRILEPGITKEREMGLKDIDVIIIPGAGFDTRGNRLGYGFGYYDKLLSKSKDVKGRSSLRSKKHLTIIALAFEEQIIPRVPDEIHDVKVDKIITDKRVINCSPPSFPQKRESRKTKKRNWIPCQARNDIQTNKNTGGIFR